MVCLFAYCIAIGIHVTGGTHGSRCLLYADISVTSELLVVTSCCYRSAVAQAYLDINVSEENRGALNMDHEQLQTALWSGEVADHRYAEEVIEPMIKNTLS